MRRPTIRSRRQLRSSLSTGGMCGAIASSMYADGARIAAGKPLECSFASAFAMAMTGPPSGGGPDAWPPSPTASSRTKTCPFSARHTNAAVLLSPGRKPGSSTGTPSSKMASKESSPCICLRCVNIAKAPRRPDNSSSWPKARYTVRCGRHGDDAPVVTAVVVSSRSTACRSVTVWPLLSQLPRPQTLPSTTSPAKGGRVQRSSSLAGTTSVWLMNSTGRSEAS
mmetsp:Transcript_6802/g.25117  ORF Transcript_6802/g.25117 Transcript_6802/m.25117 type:complete len:224 (-) Transcript_6802:191-862(-)